MSSQYSSYVQSFLGNEWGLNDNTGFYSVESDVTPFFESYQNISTDLSYPKSCFDNSPEESLQAAGLYNPNHNSFDYNQQQSQPVKDNLVPFDVDDLLSLFGDCMDNNIQSQQPTDYLQDAVQSNLSQIWLPTNEFQEMPHSGSKYSNGDNASSPNYNTLESNSLITNSLAGDWAVPILNNSYALNSSHDCAVSVSSDSYLMNSSSDDCALSTSSDSYMDSPSSNNSVSSYGETTADGRTKEATEKRKRFSKALPLIPIEMKRMRKKEQNKMAATRYRMKKKAELENLLKEENLTMEKNASLRIRRDELRSEVKHLKSLMKDVFLATMAVR